MSDVATEARPRPGTSLKGYSAPVILLLGVVIIPMLLSIAANSWSAPDDEAFVRMAFASVAGSTVAIVSVVGLLLDRIIRRASLSTIAVFGLIALVIVPWQIAAVANEGTLLLTRLGL